MSKKKDTREKIQTLINSANVSVVTNIDENYIVTTEDKIQILYHDYNQARKYTGEFWTFFGLFVTLFISVLTCEFKPCLGLTESVVHAIFILATIVAFLFCVYAGIKWACNRKKLSFKYFISQIRGDNLDD